MPPSPVIFFITPLNNSVVAFPNTLGPTIANIVLATANMKTNISCHLYLVKYLLPSLASVPLKSFAFSPAPVFLPGPCPGPILGILFTAFFSILVLTSFLHCIFKFFFRQLRKSNLSICFASSHKLSMSSFSNNLSLI